MGFKSMEERGIDGGSRDFADDPLDEEDAVDHERSHVCDSRIANVDEILTVKEALIQTKLDNPDHYTRLMSTIPRPLQQQLEQIINGLSDLMKKETALKGMQVLLRRSVPKVEANESGDSEEV